MSKKSNMQYWVDAYQNIVVSNSKRRGKLSPYAKLTRRVDNLLMYCKNCKTCWESFMSARGRRWTFYEQNQIPSLNKKRVLCPMCQDKEENNE